MPLPSPSLFTLNLLWYGWGNYRDRSPARSSAACASPTRPPCLRGSGPDASGPHRIVTPVEGLTKIGGFAPGHQRAS
ncbi:MAG TPA: hypothetical protein VGG25_13920 [Streptosporangiaceae bacterium]